MTPESRDKTSDDRHQENLRRFGHLEEGQRETHESIADIKEIVIRIDTQLKEREAERAEIKKRLDDHDDLFKIYADDASQAKGMGKLIGFILFLAEALHWIWDVVKK